VRMIVAGAACAAGRQYGGGAWAGSARRGESVRPLVSISAHQTSDIQLALFSRRAHELARVAARRVKRIYDVPVYPLYAREFIA